jgi:hypothetical protein
LVNEALYFAGRFWPNTCFFLHYPKNQFSPIELVFLYCSCDKNFWFIFILLAIVFVRFALECCRVYRKRQQSGIRASIICLRIYKNVLAGSSEKINSFCLLI